MRNGPDPVRQPRALVWMTCANCNRPLVPVELVKTIDGARRVIRIHNMTIYKTRITCPECGVARVFRSQDD